MKCVFRGFVQKYPIFEFLFNFISIFETINKNPIIYLLWYINYLQQHKNILFIMINNLFTTVYNLFTIDKYKEKIKKKKYVDK